MTTLDPIARTGRTLRLIGAVLFVLFVGVAAVWFARGRPFLGSACLLMAANNGVLCWWNHRLGRR